MTYGTNTGLEVVYMTLNARPFNPVQPGFAWLLSLPRNPASRVKWFFEPIDLCGKSDLLGMNVGVTLRNGTRELVAVGSSEPAKGPTGGTRAWWRARRAKPTW